MPFYKNKNLQLYLFFFAVTVSFYAITYKAGFSSDFSGWAIHFDRHSFWYMVNGELNHEKSFFQLTHFIQYVMLSVFRLSGLPWFLLFAGLFSLNALLVFNISKFFFDELKLENSFPVAMIGILFFLLSPYQAEVMIWRSTFHYLLAFFLMLSIVSLSLKYLKNPKKKYAYWAIAIFICSAFSLEYFLFTPFVVLVFLIFRALTENHSDLSLTNQPTNQLTNQLTSTSYYFVIIPIFLEGLYFLMQRFVNGKWLAHGRVVENTGILATHSFSNYGKYFFKEIFFLRHLPVESKEKIFAFIDTPFVGWFILIALISTCVLGLIYFKKISATGKLILLNLVLFSVLIFPVLSIYYDWLLLCEHDRYCYMPSAFLFMGFSLALSRLPKLFYYAIAGAYILFSSFLLIKTNRIWWKSEKIISNIANSFHSWDADEIYILNAPDNYNGIPMYRMINDTCSGVLESVQVYNHRTFKGKAVDVLQYNLTTPDDGITVKVISQDTLAVTLNQWGNWWWKFGLGAEDYETDDYKVKIDNACGRCYTLIMKNRKLGRVFLYQKGSELLEVK